jgi:hypothetical protein
MQTEEFIPLTKQTLREILSVRYAARVTSDKDSRRRQPRWPFPGTVELWITNREGHDEHILGRALNLSIAGIGVLMEEYIAEGEQVRIAVHQPEATFLGNALVRHTSLTEHGFRVGLEFVFD